VLVVHANDTRVHDLGVLQEESFELRRRHLEALVLDELLDTVDDPGNVSSRNSLLLT
jgi:hypothetical protein